MLIKINLLSSERLVAREQKQKIIISILCVVVVLSVIIGIWISKNNTINSLKSEKTLNEKQISKIQADIRKKQPVEKRIKEIKKDLARMEKRKEAIEKLKNGRLIWAHILDEFLNVLPDGQIDKKGIWIETMTNSRASEEQLGQLTIKGFAFGYDDIYRLYKNINENSKHFSNPVIISARKTMRSKKTLIDFQMRFDVKRDEDVKKAKSAEEEL